MGVVGPSNDHNCLLTHIERFESLMFLNTSGANNSLICGLIALKLRFSSNPMYEKIPSKSSSGGSANRVAVMALTLCTEALARYDLWGYILRPHPNTTVRRAFQPCREARLISTIRRVIGDRCSRSLKGGKRGTPDWPHLPSYSSQPTCALSLVASRSGVHEQGDGMPAPGLHAITRVLI